jgi:hypothetical protein
MAGSRFLERPAAQGNRIHKLIDENRPEVAVPGYMNLIRHHEYRLMMAQKRFRLYLDYCEGGT